MARRRNINVFGLAFLDAMTCGLGSVVLLYMIINSSIGVRAEAIQHDLTAEVNKLEEQVLEESKNLVRLRNSLETTDDDRVLAQGLSSRLLEVLVELREELATSENSALSQRQHVNRLKSDLKTLEEETRRLAASIPDEEVPGDKLRTFVGDGDRQYLTGLKVGGQRIFILVDSSASMLDETIVNVIRRRNLPDEQKIKARKWQQAVSTVDWLTTQLPRSSHFQLYTFNDSAQPLVAGSAGQWLNSGDRADLDKAVRSLRKIIPGGGTSLYHGLAAVASIKPPPDNLILLVDGLPTRGRKTPDRRTVSAKKRLEHFNRALKVLPARIPINTILFPMEGDPVAASAYWKVAIATRGSFFSPSKDWP